MRIYLVTTAEGDRLVNANTPAQAVMFVARKTITAQPAKPADVVRVMTAGGKLETNQE